METVEKAQKHCEPRGQERLRETVEDRGNQPLSC